MNDDYQGPKNLQSLFKFCINADDGKNLKESNIDPVEAAEVYTILIFLNFTNI